MKSYIKIYGPPVAKALKALEKVAVDMPEVCIMNMELMELQWLQDESLMHYFGGPGSISEERCDTIISKSGESLGEYDFYFEWFKNPTMNELHSFIEKIDDTLTEVEVRYTITTK